MSIGGGPEVATGDNPGSRPGEVPVTAAVGPPSDIPDTLRSALRHEVARVRRPPYETLIVVAANGAMMSSAWYLLPQDVTNELFSLHGSLTFALVLAAWMYSDVPATNVLAPDAVWALAALDDPVALRRLLMAKHLVLWSLVTPICLVVALATGLFSLNLVATLYSILWIAVVPLGVLALSSWVGILFPYHPMPVRYRWEHRHPRRRMLWRWLALVFVPYAVVPALGVLLMAPSLLLWGLLTTGGLSHRLPNNDLGGGVGLACVVAGVAWWVGPHVGVRIARRRRSALTAFLADPTRG